ncbi:MAG: CHAT domain-containing protein, partial [Deltaproteobacteria bacterium]|nr:CHAT domain-containing protein [Deltaproteobacteria bacterium]
ELKGAGARTIMLSLDGRLRDIPVAALWTGERWVAELYPTAIFTPVTSDKQLTPPPPGDASVIALGVSEGLEYLPPMPGVAAEIERLVGSGSKPGFLKGSAVMNRDFTRAEFFRAISSGAQIVHIASRFTLDYGNFDNSSLFLGDGDTISIRELKLSPEFNLKGADLVTLTVVDSSAKNGIIQDLGEFFQMRGASALLTTLVSVNDNSAADFIPEFYRQRYVAGKNKAEALREAQLAFLSQATPEDAGQPGAPHPPSGGSGMSSAPSSADSNAGNVPDSAPDAPRWSGRGYSHPNHWAPYIIIGNFR